jgi:hypothetical protein
MEQLCDATSTCVAGCTKDTDCNTGRACVSGKCQGGCRSSAECVTPTTTKDAYCSATSKTCVQFKGSGRCTWDYDCASGQQCNLSTLKCDTVTGTACTGTSCDPVCPSGSACINNVCVARGTNAPCSYYNECGLDFSCSPLTGVCSALRCPAPNYSCASGLSCDLGSACNSTGSTDQFYFCTPPVITCSSDGQCSGLRCVNTGCTNAVPCTTSKDCFAAYDACYMGKCVQGYAALCTTNTDCRTDSHCDAETGHCARGAGP